MSVRHRAKVMMDRGFVPAIWLILLATFGLLTGHANTPSPQLPASPKLIDSSPQPVYPLAARAAGIEGEVQFRATVRQDGTVESVVILQVPERNLGFEEAVEHAVKKWRFQPIADTRAGMTSPYWGTIRFEASIPRQWMYPISSRTAWMHLLDLARELELSTQRVDDKHQVLITDWLRYRGDVFPPVNSLELPIGQRPDSIQFHVYVAAGLEPARVVIGSIIRSRSLDYPQAFAFYGVDASSAWLMAKLTERVGKTPERLAASAERRAAQARRLIPADVTDDCNGRVAALLPRSEEKRPGTTRPQVISDVTPVYPGAAPKDRRKRTVLFEAEITEHGTLVNMRHLKPPDGSDEFNLAAQSAATLWRFVPAIADGCRVRTTVTLEMSFRLAF